MGRSKGPPLFHCLDEVSVGYIIHYDEFTLNMMVYWCIPMASSCRKENAVLKSSENCGKKSCIFKDLNFIRLKVIQYL